MQPMNVQQGWQYTNPSINPGKPHSGIDYVRGVVDDPTPRSFAVVAAAEGTAWWAETVGEGKYVFITHQVNGQKYTSYYGHLDSIAPEIPSKASGTAKSVRRGEYIGLAGKTGELANMYLHLHFEVKNAADKAIDPYDLNTTREAYPTPNGATGTCGANHLWVSCPPKSFNDASITATPNPTPDGATKLTWNTGSGHEDGLVNAYKDGVAWEPFLDSDCRSARARGSAASCTVSGLQGGSIYVFTLYADMQPNYSLHNRRAGESFTSYEYGNTGPR